MVNAMMRAVFTVLTAVALTGSAYAQDSTVVIGGSSGKSSVTVDMSVLDALGSEPTVPDMMMTPTRRGNFQPTTPLGRRTLVPTEEFEQAAPPSGGVHLRQPGGAAPRAQTSRPSAAPKAKTQTRAAAQATRSRPATQVTRSSPLRPTLPPAPALTPPPEAPSAPAVSVPSLSSQPLPAAGPTQQAAPAARPAPTAPPQVASAPPSPAAPAAPTRNGPEFVGPTIPSTPSSPIDRSTAAPPAPTAQAAPSRPAPAAAPSSQTAALPPAAGQVSLPFSGEDATLAEPAKRQLDSVATRAARDESLRLQLLAYASGTGDAASRARRVSLSRALAVRSYLIDKGVRPTRIDVRALGNRVEGGDPDRVDVIVSGR